MAEQFYTILTATGKAKIANANALGTKLNITKLQVGDGGGSYYNPTEDQTELKHKVWQGNISSITVDENNKNWIVIETLLPGDIGGFMIREAGIFDNENNLIAIGKYPETYKPVTSEGSLKDLKIRMILEVSNATNVTLKVDPTVILATQKDIKLLENKINETNEQVKNIELTAEKVSIKDAANKFTSENVEGALKECIEKAEQAFQEADNGKKKLLQTLGNSLSANTFDDINEKIKEIIGDMKDICKNGAWATLPSMPTRRSSLGCESYEKNIYCFGGFINTGSKSYLTNVNECYDILTKTWTTKSPMPTAKQYFGYCSYKNQIYCIGGSTDLTNYSKSTDNMVYNALTNSWTSKRSLNYGISGLGCCYVDNKIYCFNSTGCKCYDTIANTWSDIPNMFQKRDRLSVAYVNGKIYCIGGGTNENVYNMFGYYDIAQNKWVNKPDIQLYGLRDGVAKAIGNLIYCFGATKNGKPDIYTLCYNTITDSWSTKKSMITNRGGFGGVLVDNKVYCIGGYPEDVKFGGYYTSLNTNECYIPEGYYV